MKGFKVVIWFNPEYFNGKKEILNNVSEIHYNYPSIVSDFSTSGGIAFESNYHSTGLTYPIPYIKEFEATEQKELAKEF
jgi:hypothetical protein